MLFAMLNPTPKIPPLLWRKKVRITKYLFLCLLGLFLAFVPLTSSSQDSGLPPLRASVVLAPQTNQWGNRIIGPDRIGIVFPSGPVAYVPVEALKNPKIREQFAPIVRKLESIMGETPTKTQKIAGRLAKIWEGQEFSSSEINAFGKLADSWNATNDSATLTTDEIQQMREQAQGAENRLGGESRLAKKEGGWLFELIGSWVVRIISWVFKIIALLIGLISSLVAKILAYLMPIPFLTVEGPTFVQTGWAFVRNIVNFFYLAVLVFIAFATVVRMESYGMRKLLAPLLVSAVLVNFSLAITGTIIDASRLVQNCIINESCRRAQNANRQAYNKLLKDVIKATQLEAFYYNEKGQQGGGSDSQNQKVSIPAALEAHAEQKGREAGIENQAFYNIATAAANVASLILALVVLFSFLVMLVLFLLRLASFIILAVLSPVAFVAMVLPRTQKASAAWWTQLLCWAFYGPIVILFLKLAVLATQKDEWRTLFQGNQGGGGGQQGTLGTVILTMVIALVISFFILGANYIARTMGCQAAGAVVGWGGKMLGRYLPTVGTLGALPATMAGIRAGVRETGRLARRRAIGITRKLPRPLGGGVARRAWGKEVGALEKKIKEEQLSNEVLKRWLTSPSRIRRAAAAKVLSERGELDTADLLASALKATQTVPAVQGEIISKARKKNIVRTVEAQVKAGLLPETQKETEIRRRAREMNVRVIREEQEPVVFTHPVVKQALTPRQKEVVRETSAGHLALETSISPTKEGRLITYNERMAGQRIQIAPEEGYKEVEKAT
jgi:hypothetical protein